MKKVWVKVIPWRKEAFTAALESGADAVIVEEGISKKVKELGLIQTIAKDGDIRPGEDVVEFEIESKEDEERALRLLRSKTLIIKAKDWKIIPFENLIAQAMGPIMAYVTSSKEAKTMIGILERGVDGVVVDVSSIDEIKETIRVVKEVEEVVSLVGAKIIEVEPLGMGDRVCVDTCSLMGEGEGILVGDSSSLLFLVHSESIENPYVTPRPFRVNAGGVHAYTLIPNGKTRYLSELKAGDEILIVNHDGRARPGIVGRTKIEHRPMLKVEGIVGDEVVSLVMQNAETIRLTRPEGKAVSVVELKKGDEVLAYKDKGGRHFGIKIEERILER